MEFLFVVVKPITARKPKEATLFWNIALHFYFGNCIFAMALFVEDGELR